MFSRKLLNSLLYEVNVGDIVGINFPNEHRDFKYFVSLVNLKNQEVNKNLRGFFINSKNRECYDCFFLSKEKHSFLSHDSYIGCSHLMEYPLEKFRIKNKQIKIYSSLSCEEIERLIIHIKNSRILNSINKNFALEALVEV